MCFVPGDLVLFAVFELGEPVLDDVNGPRLAGFDSQSLRQNKLLSVR